MLPNGILAWALVSVVGLLGLFVILYLGLGLWHLRKESVDRAHLLRGRAALHVLLQSPGGALEELRVLESLPRRLQLRLFRQTMRNLVGARNERVRALAEHLGHERWAEERCRSRRWWRRLEGARVLTLLSTGNRVMPSLLHDPVPEVRAQAVEWAATHATPEVIGRLLDLLSDPREVSRFTVQDTLLRIGHSVVEPLIRYLEIHEGVAAVPALQVARGIEDPRFIDPALSLIEDPNPIVRSHAAGLLGTIGGSTAEQALVALLTDPDPRPRAAAAQAIGILGHWGAGPLVAERLRDPSWIVRREAGLALRALGSTGKLLLRRALRSEDPFAADMARQVLDLPETTLDRGVVA